MAFPTTVNDQITDALTQTNVKVLGDAPATAMGNLFEATSQALGEAEHNATSSEPQSYITAQASTNMGVEVPEVPHALDKGAPGAPTETKPGS